MLDAIISFHPLIIHHGPMVNILVDNIPDSSGPDEQQKQPQPEVQNQAFANGSFQPAVPIHPAFYMMPRDQLEEGPTMVIF